MQMLIKGDLILLKDKLMSKSDIIYEVVIPRTVRNKTTLKIKYPKEYADYLNKNQFNLFTVDLSNSDIGIIGSSLKYSISNILYD